MGETIALATFRSGQKLVMFSCCAACWHVNSFCSITFCSNTHVRVETGVLFFMRSSSLADHRIVSIHVPETYEYSSPIRCRPWNCWLKFDTFYTTILMKQLVLVTILFHHVGECAKIIMSAVWWKNVAVNKERWSGPWSRSKNLVLALHDGAQEETSRTGGTQRKMIALHSRRCSD